MTANDSKSDLSYFNTLVDKHNNSYHRPKKSVDADFALTFCFGFEDIESGYKAPKFKAGDTFRITRCKNIFYPRLHQKLVKRYICYQFCIKSYSMVIRNQRFKWRKTYWKFL